MKNQVELSFSSKFATESELRKILKRLNLPDESISITTRSTSGKAFPANTTQRFEPATSALIVAIGTGLVTSVLYDAIKLLVKQAKKRTRKKAAARKISSETKKKN